MEGRRKSLRQLFKPRQPVPDSSRRDNLAAERPGLPYTGKRVFDVVTAAAGLLVLSPVMAIVALLVLINMGRPILFVQPRPGLGGKLFQLIKFRTMREARHPGREALDDAQRLTRFGTVLRSISLDELPELWNVLKGDMSLVGPRPLLPAYLDLYTPFQMRRHEVRPGLTGWAQVNGRNRLSWPEKFKSDVWYVDNVSLWLDLKILFLTIGQVACGHGISAEGEATMPPFRGEECGASDPILRNEKSSAPYELRGCDKAKDGEFGDPDA